MLQREVAPILSYCQALNQRQRYQLTASASQLPPNQYTYPPGNHESGAGGNGQNGGVGSAAYPIGSGNSLTNTGQITGGVGGMGGNGGHGGNGYFYYGVGGFNYYRSGNGGTAGSGGTGGVSVDLGNGASLTNTLDITGGAGGVGGSGGDAGTYSATSGSGGAGGAGGVGGVGVNLNGGVTLSEQRHHHRRQRWRRGHRRYRPRSFQLPDQSRPPRGARRKRQKVVPAARASVSLQLPINNSQMRAKRGSDGDVVPKLRAAAPEPRGGAGRPSSVFGAVTMWTALPAVRACCNGGRPPFGGAGGAGCRRMRAINLSGGVLVWRHAIA